MPYQKKQVTLQATKGFIMTQGQSGNSPISGDFQVGVSSVGSGSSQYHYQTVAVIQFEDFPDDVQGYMFSLNDPVTLSVYSLNGLLIINTFSRGEYAPFEAKSYSQLNLPNDPYTDPEGIAWFYINSHSAITPSKWLSSSTRFETLDDLKSLINGMLFWSGNSIYIEDRPFDENQISFSQKPYLTLQVFTPSTNLVDLYPDGGYVNPTQDAELSWDYVFISEYYESEIIGNPPQITSAVVTVTNKSNNKSKQYTADSPYKSITIPSLDFSADGALGPGNYSWKVDFTVTDNSYPDSSQPTGTFTTLSEIPVVIINGPNNEVVNGDAPVTFSWTYLSGVGSPQSKWEIEISSNGTQWSDLTSGEGTATSYTAPANSLPTGRIYWRIQVTDSFNGTSGNTSEWSDPALIVVQAQVAPPTITLVLNQARPVVQWTSSGQISYELQIYKNGILVYSTGETPGSATAHQVTDYLSPGSYVSRLRIRDSALEQSDWATSNFTLSFSTTLTPSLTAQSVTNGVQLTPSGMGTVNYLLRDGVPIAKITGPYTDYSASAGEHSYILRAVDASDNFTDSAAVVGTTIIRRGALLSPVTDLSQSLELWLRRGENPTRSMTSQATTTAHHAAGREFPVVDYYEFSDNELSLSFSFRSAASWEALRALLGQRQTMLYRDSHGEKLYLVVPSSSWERGRFSVDFDLSALQVDYVEAINYDPPGVVT